MLKMPQPKVQITYGFIKLDSITFGNPNQKCLELLSKSCFIEDDIVPLIKKRPYIPSSYEKVVGELNIIVDAIKTVNSKELLEDNSKYDSQPLDAVFIDYCDKNGLIYDKDLLASVLTDFMPLIAKIKYYYNRPRPYQLANYYAIPLFPALPSSSPSYPSAKALISFLMTKIIFAKNNISAEKDKDKADAITKFYNKICQSSINLGIHYPSDIEFSRLIGKLITENKKFVEKYLKTPITSPAEASEPVKEEVKADSVK